MAKLKSDRLNDVLRRLDPSKQPYENYTDLQNMLRELGDIARCKPEVNNLIQKLDELE